jgi:acyl carrier protein
MANVQSVVEQYIVDELLLGDTSEEFDGATDLIEEGFLDSLGIMSMVGFLEERFTVQIDAEEVTIENFETMDAICALVAGKLNHA